MKIRTGFVSNSSSTSYVILLPKDFDIEDYMEEFTEAELENFGKWADCSMDELKEMTPGAFNRAINNRASSFYEYEDEYGLFEFFEGLLKDFIISAQEKGGDGEGVMKFVKQEDLDKKTKYKPDPEKKKKREEKKEKLKLKHKEHDPYGEEKWEENESIKIKKFKEL